MLDAVAVDFETYYDKQAGYTLKTMGTWEYVYHPDFAAYLVSFHAPEFKYVGPIEEAPWHRLDGRVLLHHNASFDGLVMRRLWELGLIPSFRVKRTLDTADLAAWLQAPRNLKGACEQLLGLKVSKAVIADMSGKTWQQACALGMKESMLAYGGLDAEGCYTLADKFLDQWPEKERRVSELNREACWRGVQINVPAVEQAYEHLSELLLKAERDIPWIGEYTPLSHKGLRIEARKVGIPVPASLAATSEEAVEWEETYADKHPWVRAVRDYRRVNVLLNKVKNLRRQVRPDGTFPYQVKYFGASVTGRFSGGNEDSGGKFNPHNLPRRPLYGVDLRAMIIPRPGRKMYVPDYGQIEARLLLWRVGDRAALEPLLKGGNLYESRAAALLDMANTEGMKERDPDNYQMVKAMVLGCGYQMGGPKFMKQAPVLTGGKYNPDSNEANRVVTLFREKSPLVTRHWWDHHRWLQIAATHKEREYDVELHSGRCLRYFDCHMDGRQVMVSQIRGGTPIKMYGGKMTENEIQALGRDVLVDGWVALADAGVNVDFTVHDEFVIDAPGDAGPDFSRDVDRIVTTSSKWAEGCPLVMESHYLPHYKK